MDDENDPRLAFLGHKKRHGPVRRVLAIALQAIGCALIVFGLAVTLQSCSGYYLEGLFGSVGVLIVLAGMASLFVGSQLRKS